MDFIKTAAISALNDDEIEVRPFQVVTWPSLTARQRKKPVSSCASCRFVKNLEHFVCLFVFCFWRFVQIVEDENQFFGSWPAFMKIFLEIYHNVGSKLIFFLSLTFIKEYEISFWVLIFFKNVLFVLLVFFSRWYLEKLGSTSSKFVCAVFQDSFMSFQTTEYSS